MVVEIENNSEVVVDTSKDILVNKDASTKVENNLELIVSKKEYRIVGDEVVVPTTLQDAPQWLIDLSSVIVNSQIINNNQDLLNSVNTVLSNFATAYTSLSTFTNKVNTIDSDTALISTNLSTLSTSLTSSITNIESSISNLNLTKLDSNAVEALSAQVITAQVNNINTTLGSTISNIQQSIVDAESSISSNYTELSSTLTTLEGIAQASATLVDLLQTYVGMDNAGASAQTGLSAYLVGSDGQVGSADSKVTNNVYVDTLGNAKTKWDYNSVILVDGIYRKSGFGLTTNYSSGVGTEADPYLSEFWIDASRLKFTNSAQTGQVAPFTIDATGVTPQITFNGIVQFNNIANVPNYTLPEDLPTNISELTNDVGYSTTTEVNGLLNALEQSINSDISSLQNQIDGSITTWFNSYVPTLANQPASSWTTNALKNQHLGDLYYDKTTGYAYRFAYEDIEDTPDAGVIYSWIKITDTDVTLALQKAAEAQATADGKVTTFYQTTAPTAEGTGDIWIDSDNNNKMHIWNDTSWEYIRDTSKDAEIAQALQDAANAQDTADGKIVSFFQNTIPSTGSLGDIWFDTDDGNKVYRYNGTSWVAAQDSKIAQALLDAADAQATADGKITTFYQTLTPTAASIGDIWVNSTTDSTYRWNGASWILIDAAKAVNNGTTTINGGKITTNSITATQIDVDNVFAQNITYTGVITGGNQLGGGIIQSYNGNMVINLVEGSIYIS